MASSLPVSPPHSPSPFLSFALSSRFHHLPPSAVLTSPRLWLPCKLSCSTVQRKSACPPRSRHLRVWEHVLIGPARPPDSAACLAPCPPAGVSPSTRGVCVCPQALGSRVGVRGVGGVSLYLLSGTPTASATFHEPPAVPKSAACAPHSFS